MRFLVSNTKFIVIQNKSKEKRKRGDKIRRKIQMDTTREGSIIKRIFRNGCELSRRKRGKIRKLIYTG